MADVARNRGPVSILISPWLTGKRLLKEKKKSICGWMDRSISLSTQCLWEKKPVAKHTRTSSLLQPSVQDVTNQASELWHDKHTITTTNNTHTHTPQSRWRCSDGETSGVKINHMNGRKGKKPQHTRIIIHTHKHACSFHSSDGRMHCWKAVPTAKEWAKNKNKTKKRGCNACWLSSCKMLWLFHSVKWAFNKEKNKNKNK